MPTAQTDEARERELTKLLKGLTKEFDTPVGYMASDDFIIDIPRFTSGIPSLDAATGGGLPYGRVTEIFGAEATGKTTVMLTAMAHAQQEGKTVAIIDTEHALNSSLAESVGLDLSRAILAQPDSGDDAADMARKLAESGAVDIIGLDSTASLATRAELEKGTTDPTMALTARLMSTLLRTIQPSLNKNQCAFILISQMRQNPGQYGAPLAPTGGGAIKYFASLRIQLAASKKDRIPAPKGVEGFVGTKVGASIVKNKLAPPFKTAQWSLLYGKGVDEVDGVLQQALIDGVVQKPGAGNLHYQKFAGPDLTPVDIKIANGMPATLQAINDNPELYKSIKEASEALRRNPRNLFESEEDAEEASVADIAAASELDAPGLL